MKTKINQKGFSIIETVILIIVIAGLCVLGFKAYDSWQTANTAKEAAAEQSKTASDVPASSSITAITDTSGIDQAADTLNSVNIDDSGDVTLLTNEASNF